MSKIATAILSLCVLIGGVVAASATTATVFKYTNPKSGFLALDQFAFSPDGSNTASNFYIKSQTGGLTTSPDGCFTAGMTLPNGATLTKVVVWYKKSSPSSARIALRWRQFSNGRSEALIDQFLPGSAGLPRTSASFDIPAPEAVVSNGNRSYGAIICLGTNDIFWGARVQYTYDNAGD